VDIAIDHIKSSLLVRNGTVSQSRAKRYTYKMKSDFENILMKTACNIKASAEAQKKKNKSKSKTK
jgi:hypothetical protein